MSYYSLLQFSKWMGWQGLADEAITGVSVDSRLIQPGHLFFALEGANTDGHLFLKEVAEKKAAGAVVSKNYPGRIEGLPLIKVDNVLLALQSLCQKMMESRKQKIVAVTGSVGKTTTKDFITTLLSEKYKVASTPGNSNSQIGLPLSLFNHTKGNEEILVLEMGMTHPGQISRLVQLAPPDIAVLTKVALVHACNFDSLEGIAQAKSEIFSHTKTSTAIFDRHNVNYRQLMKLDNKKRINFAIQCNDSSYNLNFKDGIVEIKTAGEEFVYDFWKIPGKHNLHNYLASIVVARELSLSWEEIRKGTARLSLPERRLQKVEKEGLLFINDSYNASPESVKAALKSIPEPAKGRRKIAVLGEMLELGKFSRPCHLETARFALRHLDALFCYGQECYPMKEIWEQAGKPVCWASDRAGILDSLRKMVCAGDVILLKGSRSKEVWKVLEEL